MVSSRQKQQTDDPHHTPVALFSHLFSFLFAIFCTEMGLGKSIQTIGLMLANPPAVQGELTSKSNMTHCTLIVGPKGTLKHWENEIPKFDKKNALKVCTFHGNAKQKQAAIDKVQTGSVNVLLTTFSTLASHFQSYLHCLKVEHDKSKSFLFGNVFWRVILDEAHCVRNRSTNLFKAVMGLQAVNRWCLTGTPTLNKPDDAQPYFACKLFFYRMRTLPSICYPHSHLPYHVH
jgi:SNF2 family DNA or RNA helicase